jgi:hypothetical protein
MPDELDPDEDEGVVAAAPPEEELEGCVDGAGDDVDELEAFEPQAATARATRTIAAAANRRTDLGEVEVMNRLLQGVVEVLLAPQGRSPADFVPLDASSVVFPQGLTAARERRTGRNRR